MSYGMPGMAYAVFGDVSHSKSALWGALRLLGSISG